MGYLKSKEKRRIHAEMINRHTNKPKTVSNAAIDAFKAVPYQKIYAERMKASEQKQSQ